METKKSLLNWASNSKVSSSLIFRNCHSIIIHFCNFSSFLQILMHYLLKFPPGQPYFFYVLHNSMLSIGIDLKSVVIQHAFKQLNYQGFSRQLCCINQSFFIQKLIQLVLYRFSHNRFDALGILIVSSANYLWFCGITLADCQCQGQIIVK